MILNQEYFKLYFDKFNSNDEENVVQFVDNASAWFYMKDNIPLFECPDKQFEETYYFRWWTYRKHLKKTSDGFIITEFHPDVFWAGRHNSINCALGHHLNEGRWLKNRTDFLNDFIIFWLKKGGSLRAYSTWLADAIWNYSLVIGDFSLAEELLPDLVENYYAWEKSNKNNSGLYWSYDDRDAMEFSISGSGLRPTLNSYMYADAIAISKIAKLDRKSEIETEFGAKAAKLKSLIQDKLWDKNAEFFKVIPLMKKDDEVKDWKFDSINPENNVRELIGFIPWYFNIPDAGYECAWKQLMCKNGFYAPYGPTTAEQRHFRFMFRYDEHECLWNGPSWPFATAQTITAIAHLLNNYSQSIIDKQDYYEILKIYTKCHYRKKHDGKIVSWIDENLDPYTGEWISRNILKKWNWRKDKGGKERGKDYNHSTYCDLIITGLVGLRPREDEILEINPLITEEEWDYFCLEKLSYHGKEITILYDKTGLYYKRGVGFQVFVDGIKVSELPTLGIIKVKLQ